MKASIVVLALLVGAAQTVAAADCCCFVVCEHRNENCDDCGHKKDAPARPDCCSTEAPPQDQEGTGRCAHVEPSGEVVVHAAELAVAPPSLEFALESAPVIPSRRHDSTRLVCDATESPPLFILHHALLR